MKRRTFQRFLGAAAVAPLAAQAQGAYPSRTIRIIVPYPAGGASDFLARLVGDRLGKVLGQSVIIENRSGASGSLGMSEGARAASDGYTLVLAASDAMVNNAALFKSLSYDPQRDFVLLTKSVFSPALISANSELAVKSMGDLKRFIADRRPSLSYGSWGIGSLGHIAGEALSKQLKGGFVHVPQRGEALVLNDLLTKSISFGVTSAGIARQHVAAGKINALGILGRERSNVLPSVPTLREQGFVDPIFDAGVWLGFIVPARTPGDIVQRLTNEIRTIVGQPDVTAAMAERGLEVINTTAEQFRLGYQAEFEIITQKIREAGIEPQ